MAKKQKREVPVEADESVTPDEEITPDFEDDPLRLAEEGPIGTSDEHSPATALTFDALIQKLDAYVIAERRAAQHRHEPFDMLDPDRRAEIVAAIHAYAER